MSPELLFLLGTALKYFGFFAFARGLVLGLRLAFRSPGMDADRTRKGLVSTLIFGALAWVIAAGIPMSLGREVSQTSDWHLPLVWVSMPLPAWVTVAGIVGAVLSFSKVLLQLTADRAPMRAGIAWTVIAAGGFYWFLNAAIQVEILRGAIPIKPTIAIALIALLVAALFVMVAAGRAANTRGYAKATVIHLALLAGSFVFALPFFWLLITSFKEDRDMASPNGIVWVPRVQQVVPYRNPNRPLFESTYKGKSVQCETLSTNDDGSFRMEIIKPGNLRGLTFDAKPNDLNEVDRYIPVVTAKFQNENVKGKVVEEMLDGRRVVEVMEPSRLAGEKFTATSADLEPYRNVGLRWKNYPEALEYLPLETNFGLVYLKNTLLLVVLTVLGTILSSSIVAYAFSRLRFPGKGGLFMLLLSTMMLPGAVTMLPTFLIFRTLGWIDTLYPIWVPSFFASAFNVFMLRQFFMQIPMELEDAAKIDGCSYWRTFWSVMVPQVKPALAVIGIWTTLGAWNNFIGPLIYINSPEKMPIAYALQLFQSDRGTEAGLMMAFTTLSVMPVVLLFFVAQKYFIEGVTLSGLGGR